MGGGSAQAHKKNVLLSNCRNCQLRCAVCLKPTLTLSASSYVTAPQTTYSCLQKSPHVSMCLKLFACFVSKTPADCETSTAVVEELLKHTCRYGVCEYRGVLLVV